MYRPVYINGFIRLVLFSMNTLLVIQWASIYIYVYDRKIRKEVR
jgi:hypothetical protein